MSYHTIIGFIVGVIGLVGFYSGWKNRERYQLVTETSTTKIRRIDSEGPVEVTGTVGSADGGGGFTSPIGRTNETVVVAWQVETYKRTEHGGMWVTKARGVDSEPFTVDDGTARVRVEIGDRVARKGEMESSDLLDPNDGLVDGLVCEFHENTVVEEVDSQDAPQHIESFVRDTLFEDESSDGDHPSGRVRYSEQTLGVGDDVYLLGDVRATAGATTPLQPEDAVVTPADGEPFIVSDQPEEVLTDRLSDYQDDFTLAALLLLLSVILIVAGTTTLL